MKRALIYFALAALPAFGQLNVRQIDLYNDVSAIAADDVIKWDAGESVQLNVYLSREDTAIAVTSTSAPVWKAWLASDESTLYINKTGTVVDATSAHLRVSLTPAEANLATGAYSSVVQLYEGTNYMGVISYTTNMTVRYSPAASGLAYVGATPAYPNTLEELTNVTSGATSGQGIIYNGTNWTPTDVATQAELDALNLDDLADVSASAPSDGESLTYNAASGTWTNSAAGAGDMTKAEFVDGTGIVAQAAAVDTVNGASGGTVTSSILASNAGAVSAQAYSTGAGAYLIADSPAGQDAHTIYQHGNTNLWVAGLISTTGNGGNATTNYFVKSVSGGTGTTRMSIDYNTGAISGNGSGLTNLSAASTSAAGVVELATQAEVDAGTDTSRAVTSAGVKDWTPDLEAVTYTSTNLTFALDGYDVYTATLTNAVNVTFTVADSTHDHAAEVKLFWSAGASQTWPTNNTPTVTFIGGSAPAITSNAWNHVTVYYDSKRTNVTVGLMP